jgi:putative hemolysin
MSLPNRLRGLPPILPQTQVSPAECPPMAARDHQAHHYSRVKGIGQTWVPMGLCMGENCPCDNECDDPRDDFHFHPSVSVVSRLHGSWCNSDFSPIDIHQPSAGRPCKYEASACERYYCIETGGELASTPRLRGILWFT